MTSTAQLYAVSRATLYRLLRGDRRPKDAHRTDRGYPRSMPAPEIERWCEIVAAMKVRTTNRKGRHLSTVRTLQLLVEYGVDTPDGFRKLDPGKLTASTLNRHLRRLGYDHERMVRQPPAVRFQAEHSNALWHFDMSPSDLKQLKAPPWIDADRQGSPTLMLFSVVDDRSGVAYQEYRCVYGEDAETALRFLFNAMALKASTEQSERPAQGVRQMCAWERFCVFAREPERRLVDINCRLTVAGVTYEVDAELAGETVVVWWGLFDQELWVEHDEERRGPFLPVGGPIPLHRYRKHRKSRQEVRADQVSELAAKLALPRAALSGEDGVVMTGATTHAGLAAVPVRPFRDPDPFHELGFANQIAARRAIAEEIRLPLAKLSDEDRAFIDALLARTLVRPEILAAVRERFPQGRRGGVG
jgi:hypothetical protein